MITNCDDLRKEIINNIGDFWYEYDIDAIAQDLYEYDGQEYKVRYEYATPTEWWDALAQYDNSPRLYDIQDRYRYSYKDATDKVLDSLESRYGQRSLTEYDVEEIVDESFEEAEDGGGLAVKARYIDHSSDTDLEFSSRWYDMTQHIVRDTDYQQRF